MCSVARKENENGSLQYVKQRTYYVTTQCAAVYLLYIRPSRRRRRSHRAAEILLRRCASFSLNIFIYRND